jgi:Glyoxalase superfamily protein
MNEVAMTIAFLKTIPILRIFSVEKAKEFYVDYSALPLIGNTTSRTTRRPISRCPGAAWCCT